MGQSIRPSQYITTYGPGSILEGELGPKVILSLQHSDLFHGTITPSSYEITDQRFSQSLLQGGRIVRIPSNAEIGVPDEQDIYTTDSFPSWSLCTEHGIIYKYNVTREEGTCPQCRRSSDKWENWRKSRREAIRFIVACKNGHMNDVDWPGLPNHKRQNCRPEYLYWKGGGSLSDVTIECPTCGGETNLGTEYGKEHRCGGRKPELRLLQSSCNERAKMIQRGAANLRIPEILSSLTIPKLCTKLHELLARHDVMSILIGRIFTSKNDLITLLDNMSKPPLKLVTPAVVAELNEYEEHPIFQALEDIKAEIAEKTPHQYRVDELDALQKAATDGEPVQPASTPWSPPMFEVLRNEVCRIEGENGNALRITPVSRLRVVCVQLGYRRLDTINTPLVPVHYEDGGYPWYPGVELHGEGIFIDLQPQEGMKYANHFMLEGTEYEKWQEAYENWSDFGYEGKVASQETLHPVFVWWHTLAHRLINSLSVDSGYSSASIRERVYIKITEDGITGGILLYTAQPGGDGTLGGLIAMVPKFKRVLRSALRDIHTCSNDPLCSENEFNPGLYNGPACYACQLVSETSCEHRNMLLDRNLLKRNLP